MSPMAALAMAVIISTSATALDRPAGEVTHYEPIGRYTISAYSSRECPNELTASGTAPVPYRTVASMGLFPYGTQLYIEGIGNVTVEDTGNFPADRLDLYVGRDDGMAFGLKDRMVYRIVTKKVTARDRAITKLKKYGERRKDR